MTKAEALSKIEGLKLYIEQLDGKVQPGDIVPGRKFRSKYLSMVIVREGSGGYRLGGLYDNEFVLFSDPVRTDIQMASCLNSMQATPL